MRRQPMQVIRAELRAELAGLLSKVIFDEKLEQLDLKHATGASASVVQRWCSRDEAPTPSLADIVLIGQSYPTIARRLFAWAADQLGLVVAPRLAGSAPADHLQHAARIAREHSECLGAVLEAHADGKVDDDELGRIDRELADVEGAYAALRAWVESEKARRGLGAIEKRGERVRQTAASALRVVQRDSGESPF